MTNVSSYIYFVMLLVPPYLLQLLFDYFTKCIRFYVISLLDLSYCYQVIDKLKYIVIYIFIFINIKF